MMENVNGLSPELIVHPGETIKELLEDKGMTQEELATRTGYTPKHVSEIISGKKNISAKFANTLEYALGVPTEFWINLQGIYDKNIIELEKANNISSKEYDILEQLKDILPGIALAVFMGCCVNLVGLFNLPNFITLLIQIPLGASIYIATSALLHLESFEYLMDMIRPMVRKIIRK